MGSQFVDFNADGLTDYFTATFDGSPHVALGLRGGGFAEPERLLDKNGKRIMLDDFWDYDAKKWSNTGSGEGHCTSAVAFDWDADGDYDLLLGTYHDGNLYLQLNEGKPGDPAFTGVSVPVLAGGKPFGLHGGITAPRLFDWDGDGLTDLVCGSYGDSWTSKPPGGVYWYRNTGKVGAPEFAAAEALIPPTATTGHEPDRPNVGLYADPVDYDGDGDVDLVVGGYSIWTPVQPELTAEQAARADELKEKLGTANAELEKMFDAVTKATAGLGEDEQRKRMKSLTDSDDYKRLVNDVRAMGAELATLRSTQQRKAGVWVYLRQSP